jgi:ribonuclease HI
MHFLEDDEIPTDAVLVYTDGSSRNTTTREGGWAFHCLCEEEEAEAKRWGYLPAPTTNNIAELMAILRALQFVALTDRPLFVFSDSAYAINALNVWLMGWRENGWVGSQGQPVKNIPLFEEIDRYLELHRSVRQVALRHIKGHAGHIYNESADQMAGIAMRTQDTNWSEDDHENRLET